MREDFTEFDMPASLEEVFPPDGTRLFDLLCRRMTDGMLRFIAEADYGYIDSIVRTHDASVRSGAEAHAADG